MATFFQRTIDNCQKLIVKIKRCNCTPLNRFDLAFSQKKKKQTGFGEKRAEIYIYGTDYIELVLLENDVEMHFGMFWRKNNSFHFKFFVCLSRRFWLFTN